MTRVFERDGAYRAVFSLIRDNWYITVWEEWTDDVEYAIVAHSDFTARPTRDVEHDLAAVLIDEGWNEL